MDDSLTLSPEDQSVVDSIGEQYAALRKAYDLWDTVAKRQRAIIRDALVALDERLGVYLEKVRDNSTDEATIRTPAGTFSTQRVGAFKVTDTEAFHRALVSGLLPVSALGDNVNKRLLTDILEENMRKQGYYDLPMDEKERIDLNRYLPDAGVQYSPYERTIFRKSRSL